MDTEETATIVRLVKSVFPQQPIDRATYETWHLVIGHLNYTVAQAAVIAIAHSEKFCAAADIIAEADRASRRHAHPSERTVAEALGVTEVPAIGAARTEPTPEYIAAKDQMDARIRERAKEVMFTDREAGRRASLWLQYKLSGKLPPALPLSGPPAPRWVGLPGDPPELLAWLSRQQAEAAPP
jgi:hypothetical protein